MITPPHDDDAVNPLTEQELILLDILVFDSDLRVDTDAIAEEIAEFNKKTRRSNSPRNGSKKHPEEPSSNMDLSLIRAIRLLGAEYTKNG
jgi:hypothetical protein